MALLKKLNIKKHQDGFSMIEIIVVAGLFGIMSYVLFNALTDADNAQHRLDMQLRMRHVLDKTMTEVSYGYAYFVPIRDKKFYYYACFDREGKRTETKNGSIEYGIMSAPNVKAPAEECKGSKFMSYVQTDSQKKEARIIVCTVNEKTAKKQACYKKPTILPLSRGY